MRPWEMEAVPENCDASEDDDDVGHQIGEPWLLRSGAGDGAWKRLPRKRCHRCEWLG